MLVLVCFLRLSALGADSTADGSQHWDSGEGYRRTPLLVPETHRAGFIKRTSDYTGLNHTNTLTAENLAANQILEVGSGVAAGDVDGDGRVDLYFCTLTKGNHLYRNLGEFKFEDITLKAGVSCVDQVSTGAVLADVNGDGQLDLLVTSIGNGPRLFLNQGQGVFQEAAQWGLIHGEGSTSMTLADVDGDGWLDLYVANYNTRTIKDSMKDLDVSAGFVNGRFVVSRPDLFQPILLKSGGASLFELGQPDHLYRNLGGAGFAAVPWTNGIFSDENGHPIAEPPREWGLSARFHDLNGDGFPDLYVCNDFFSSEDRVWINQGNGSFRLLSPLSLRHRSMSSMAVDVADINGDGREDLLVVDMMSQERQRRQKQRASLIHLLAATSYEDPRSSPEYPRNTLFLNRGDGTYAEIARYAGLDASEWSWGTAMLDVDLDGYPDVLIATGTARDANDADLAEQSKQTTSRSADPSRKTRSFPILETPLQAFRNHSDLTFSSASEAWGFDTVGVAHGLALADLDNDGDLDVIINPLNRGPEVYQNQSDKPRVAIRLRGKHPNTQAIGSMIRATQPGFPIQVHEISSGGRYLSGDDPLTVFALRPGDPSLQVDITWRSGKESHYPQLRAGYLYEVTEPDSAPPSKRSPVASLPIAHEISTLASSNLFFQDISAVLKIKHSHSDLDDREVQPLLPRKMTELGPPLAWFDLDGDGWEDLLPGSGSQSLQVVYLNDRHGGFRPIRRKEKSLGNQTMMLGIHDADQKPRVLFAWSSSEHQTPLPGAVMQYTLKQEGDEPVVSEFGSSVGPLALGMFGDTPVLFVGGRIVPGRYPLAADSVLYTMQNGQWILDVTNTLALRRLGLVSGAVWADLDGDGKPELAVATEWGPIRVFALHERLLVERTQALGLTQFAGGWTGITVGDFDGDGLLDLAASNWGLNNTYRRNAQKPVRLYFGDFSNAGRIDMLEAFWEPQEKEYFPAMPLDRLRTLLPNIAARFPTFADFSKATMPNVLEGLEAPVQHLDGNWFTATVFLNRKDHFDPHPLEAEAQFASSFGISVGDLDGDGKEDLFLAQNFFGLDPDVGREDAGRGLWLKGDGIGGFQTVPARESGIALYGEQRSVALCDFDQDGRIDVAVTQNRGSIGLFKNVRAKPGIRVRLKGKGSNPDGIGCALRLVKGQELGPMRWVSAGSGYASQESTTQVLGFTGHSAPTGVWVRWPSGMTQVTPIPLSETSLEIREP